MKKTFSHTMIIAMAAIIAFTFSTCDNPSSLATPVITITAQPAPTTNVMTGSISGTLTVAGSVTEGASLAFQWFSNTENSNVGGTTITGATGASFTIPTNLGLGTHYFFSEISASGAAAVRSNVAAVVVGEVPVPVITITAQPAPTTNVTVGSISGTLTVAAGVTEGASLAFQWFSNMENSNVGGTAITGATGASFTIPTGLGLGTHYFFSEISASGAAAVRSNVVRVMVHLDMVWVEGGTFNFGEEIGTAIHGNVTPVSTVTLTTGFYMGRFPVTQAQFQEVMGNNPSAHREGGIFASRVAGMNTDNHPVERVSWFDAIVFSNLLSIMSELTSAYEMQTEADPEVWSTDPATWGAVPTSTNTRWNAVRIVPGSTGYRLPTEAQWEFAAKGGNTGERFTFPGSNNAVEVAWHIANSGGITHSVGSLAPNGLGIYDMSGNVLELVWSLNNGRPAAGTTVNDPTCGSGAVRVARGGYWGGTALPSGSFIGMRSVDRRSILPWDRSAVPGFRVVRPGQM